MMIVIITNIDEMNSNGMTSKKSRLSKLSNLNPFIVYFFALIIVFTIINKYIIKNMLGGIKREKAVTDSLTAGRKK